MTYDEVLEKAIEAATQAQDAAEAFDHIDDEHPHFDSFTSHYHKRSVLYAQLAQAWATCALAHTTRSLEAMEAGL